MSAAASGRGGLRAASGARKLARSTRLLGILFLILASCYGTDAAAKRLVIVAINTATTAQTFTFNLSGFTTVTGGTNGLVPRWNTHTSGGTDRYRAYSDTRLNGKSVAVPFAAGAVQTLQIDGVTI